MAFSVKASWQVFCCRHLINKDHFMALNQVQTPTKEPICRVVTIRDLVLEVHQFLVWGQTAGAGSPLKTADCEEEAVFPYVAATVVLIFLASKTEDQGPQSLRLKIQLIMVLLLMIRNIANHLPRSMMSHTTNQILWLNIRMLSSSSSSHTVKIMFTRASNMVFGPALQMGIENWILPIMKLRTSKILVLCFSYFRYIPDSSVFKD